jgi:CBS domain-containing protein
MTLDNLQDNDHERCEPNLEAQGVLDRIHELDQSLREFSFEAQVPHKVQEVSRQIHENKVEVQETVRTLLSWFGAKRRGFYVIHSIQTALAEVGLRTEPHFASVYIDAKVRIIPIQLYDDISDFQSIEDGSALKIELPDAIPEGTTDEFVSGAVVEDPTFRIGKLESANNTPINVAPDSTLLEATTLMMFHDFSQLPVMQGSREIKGSVSWESIGKRKALNLSCEKVRDCMETVVPEVSSESSLFSAIDLIVKHGYVLVRQRDRIISGIVTTTDLSLQFRQLAEPFLLVGEIENYIRRLIVGKFTVEQLSSVLSLNDDSRTINTVADFTFGDYLRLLEKPNYWERLQIPVDRAIFIKKLDRVRELRNDVMHFDPDPFAEEDLQMLRLFANFMRVLDIKRD